MLVSTVLGLVLFAQTPLPRPVATLVVESGEVRLERKAGDPAIITKTARLRVGDKITILQKGRITVRIDQSRSTWRLPDAGAFLAGEKGLEGQAGVKAQLIAQQRPVHRRPGALSAVVSDKIRTGPLEIAPWGCVPPGAVSLSWTKTPSVQETRLELLDAKGKTLWKAAKPGAIAALGLPSGMPPKGAWTQVRIVLKSPGKTEVSSAWLRVLSDAEQSALQSSEVELRAALKDDPRALGLALGDLWADYRLGSRLAEAARMAFGSEDSAEAQWHLGSWYELAGYPAKAKEEYERSWAAGERGALLKEAIERLGGKPELQEWEKLASVRDRLVHERKFQEALPIAKSIIETLRKEKPESLQLARALFRLGVIVYEAGERDAEKAWIESLSITRQLAPDSLMVARSYINLGVVAHKRKSWTESQRFYSTALSIHQKLAPNSFGVAECLYSLGNLMHDQRNFAEAQRLTTEALTIWQRLDPDSPTIPRLIINLGLVASDRGDLVEAQRLYEKALAIYEKANPDSIGLAGSVTGLANIAAVRGDLAEAQRLYEKALAIYEKANPDSIELAGIVNNLGLVAQARGDLDEARRLYEIALAIYEKRDSNSMAIPGILNNIGEAVLDGGDLDEAQRLYAKALAVYEKWDSNSVGAAQSFSGLAKVALQRGDLAEAQSLHAKALAIQEELTLGPLADPSMVINAGIFAALRGDFEEARRFLARALVIQEGISPDSLDTAVILHNLGAVTRTRSDFAETAALVLKELNVIDEILRKKGYGMAADLGSYGVIATRALATTGWLKNPQDFYAWLPTLRGAGFTLQVRARLSEEEGGKDKTVQDARSAVQMATKSETDWATNPRPTGMDAKTWEDMLLELRAKRQSAELKLSDLLAAKDPRLAAPLKVETSQVQQALGEGHVLVEYLQIASWDNKAKQEGLPAYGAFVVAKQGDVKFVRLAPAKEIDALIEDWQLQLALATDPNVQESTLGETEKALKALGHKLHDKLIKPLGKLPQDLLIAPDSLLHALSFGALVDGKGRYLLESKILSYVSSGRDLVEKPLTAKHGAPVVIAGPDFGAGAEALLPGKEAAKTKREVLRSPNATGAWDLLPAASIEGEEVGKMLGVQPVMGASASEEMLLSVSRPRVLHIATHGFFFPPPFEKKDREDMLLSGLTGRGIRVADSPMLRSGLVLAGANRDSELREKGLADGWATALELTGMDLRGTELVVLSACETGRGDPRGAEGVFGLQRAFRFAGAQSLLMSLFKVPDSATQKLMQSFYRDWKPGSPAGAKVAALRGAQLAILKDPATRHPRNWAAFVLMGNR